MIRLAFYGKGGIGKSATVSNLAAAMTEMGLRVLQIGCDPKADSTICHQNGFRMKTVLELVRERKDCFTLEEMVRTGEDGVFCAEAGGPSPGLGCAGRGIISALEKLEEKGVYDRIRPDVVLYDVLGDVVCGGFTMPMRAGYADQVYILTSGENMSLYAAGNIAMAVERFKGRGYASLGGFIVNSRETKKEGERTQQLAEDFGSRILMTLSRSPLVPEAEEQNRTVVKAFPDSDMAEQYRKLARLLLENTGERQADSREQSRTPVNEVEAAYAEG